VQLSINYQKVEAFLKAVAEADIKIGVREHIDIMKLFKSRDQWSASELRASVSAVLSTSSYQFQQIGNIFDNYILSQENKISDLPPQIILKTGETGIEKKEDVLPEGSFFYKILGAFFEKYLRIFVITSLILSFLIPIGWGTIIIVNKILQESPNQSITKDEKIFKSTPKKITITEKKQTEHIQTDYSTILVEPARQIMIPYRLKMILYINEEGIITKRDLIADDWYTLILFWLFTTISLRWWKLPEEAHNRRKFEREMRLEQSLIKRKELMQSAADKGVSLYLSYHVKPYTPISKSVLNDAATFFGRLYRHERGTELDIPATLKKTVSKAGMFNPHFKSGKGNRELLVLIDIERGDHPWLGGFERTLDYLAKQGVKMVKFRFQYTPSWVVSDQDGTTITFKELNRKFSDDALIIFSRNLSMEDREGYADWINALKPWEVKAWIDPAPFAFDMHYQRKDIQLFENIGLKRFPLTTEGITYLAIYLSSEDPSMPTVPWPTCPSIEDSKMQNALRTWAICAAIVPDANWDQLEAVRRDPDFPEVSSVLTEPWHIQLLLDWISNLTKSDAISGDGRTLAVDMQIVDQLIRKQRQEDKYSISKGPLEKRMRQLLLKQLESAKRPDDEMATYLWELKAAEHKMILSPDLAENLMHRFFGSPVEIEATEVLEKELNRQHDGDILENHSISSSMKERLQILTGVAEGVEVTALFWGNFRSWVNTMIVSLVLTLMLGMAIWICDSVGEPLDFLQRNKVSNIKVTIPSTYRIEKNISNN